MQNQTDLFRVPVGDKLRHLAREHRQWFIMLGSAFSGYVMSNSLLFGSVAPFGVAFCAALPWKYVTGAAIGAILGHILRFGQIETMKYIAAILFLVAIKWLIGKRQIRLEGPVAAIGTAGVSMLMATALILVAMSATMYDLLLAGAELLLACGAAYFFARALSSMDYGFSGVSRSDICCLAISFSVVIMGFATFSAGGFSLGRILSVVIVLLCARYGGEGAGAISGIVAGIAMGLTGRDFGYTVSSYAFGGLIAGIFGQVGRLAAGSAFVIVNAICAIFLGGITDVYTALGEIFIASVIFLALPQRWLKKMRITDLRPVREDGTATQQALRGRMEDVAHTLRDISTATHEVSRRLGKLESTGLEGIYTGIGDRVCRHCGMRTSCWQDNHGDTMNALGDCVRALKRDGSINREGMPVHFRSKCCKLDSLLGELNAQFQQQVSREGVQRKVAQVRSVVTDQFEGMALMMDELAGELCALRLMDAERTRRVKEYLEGQGLLVRRVICWQDEYLRTHLEAAIPSYHVAKLNRVKLTLDLSMILECELDSPSVDTREMESVVTLREKATFTMEIGAYQKASGSNRLCGDTYDYLREKSGKTHLILSDGMGSGGAAAVDSSMTTGLITRLLQVGVGHDAALKMVNSALLIKSGEESLATVDICSVDLFSGQAEFYKAGAAPTYLLREGKAGYVESTSLPAGILRGVSFEKSTLTLREGDIIIMVSDGVTATGGRWLIPELQGMDAPDMQRMAEMIANCAAEHRDDGREDDITVLAACLHRGV